MHFEKQHWPTVHLSWPAGADPTAPAAFVEGLEELLLQRQTFVLLVDCSRAVALGSGERHTIVTGMKKLNPLTGRYLQGVGVLLRSRMQRGVLTAVTWIWAPPFAVETFHGHDAAQAWAEERLNGVRLSA